jgi:AraC-like DNA-binding protein
MEFLLAITMGFLLHAIGYVALDERILSPSNDGRIQKPKYQGTNLSADQLKDYHQKLINLMSQKKPYLKTELRLLEVSQLLNIPAAYLSLLLNDYMKTSFNDFINEYRVKEVIRKLENGEHQQYSLQSLGLDSGFSNKTTFYRAFKKITGETPLAYSKKYIRP